MKSILGKHAWTSIVGYALAGLMVVDQAMKAGTTDWKAVAVAVLIAVLGRISADSKNTISKV